jgi:hypothetical protein
VNVDYRYSYGEVPSIVLIDFTDTQRAYSYMQKSFGYSNVSTQLASMLYEVFFTERNRRS